MTSIGRTLIFFAKYMYAYDSIKVATCTYLNIADMVNVHYGVRAFIMFLVDKSYHIFSFSTYTYHILLLTSYLSLMITLLLFFRKTSIQRPWPSPQQVQYQTWVPLGWCRSFQWIWEKKICYAGQQDGNTVPSLQVEYWGHVRFNKGAVEKVDYRRNVSGRSIGTTIVLKNCCVGHNGERQKGKDLACLSTG